MAQVGGEGPPQFLSTHPSPANRQQTLADLAPKMQPFYDAAKATPPPSFPIKATDIPH